MTPTEVQSLMDSAACWCSVTLDPAEQAKLELLAGILAASGGGGGSPALPFNSVQFNNAGAFGGDAGFTFAGGVLTVSDILVPLKFDSTIRQLLDGAGNISIDWLNRMTFDDVGVDSLRWNGRELVDSASIPSVDWDVRRLKNAAGTTVLDWSAQQPSSGAQVAGAVYTATEQIMIQEMYDALRAYGLLS